MQNPFIYQVTVLLLVCDVKTDRVNIELVVTSIIIIQVGYSVD